MKNILIIYSTTDGHTIDICQKIQSVIEGYSHNVTLVELDDAPKLVLNDFDKIIIGASIRHGKHNPKVHKFIEQYQEVLESKPSAFFSVNMLARKPNRNTPATSPYVIKFFKKTNWTPTLISVFAGKINYPIYNWYERLMIQMIMYLTKGPTDPSTVKSFTDWESVEQFGHDICKL